MKKINKKNNLKTIKKSSDYGTNISEDKIFPALLAFERTKLVEKSFLNSQRGFYTQNGENLTQYSSYYTPNGMLIIDEIVVDRITLDTFKRHTVKESSQFSDVYEALIFENNDINGLTGSYIKFEYIPNEDGSSDGKFNEIIYRHYSDEYEYFIKKYSDDELNSILKENPNHPMIQLMHKTIDKLTQTKNLSSEKDIIFKQSEANHHISECAIQMQ